MLNQIYVACNLELLLLCTHGYWGYLNNRLSWCRPQASQIVGSPNITQTDLNLLFLLHCFINTGHFNDWNFLYFSLLNISLDVSTTNAINMQRINYQETKKVRSASQYLACPLRPYMCYVQGELQQEMSYLRSKVFPYLDSLCLTRGTCFRPVDLQQSKEEGDEDDDNGECCIKGHVDEHSFQTTHEPPTLPGQRLKISLDLIDRSSFFICLLGHRYGQFLQEENGSTDFGPCSLSEVARSLQVAAMSGYPWVMEDEYRTCSLTELEIIKAAFHDTHRICFFYFKDFTHQDNVVNSSDDMFLSLKEMYIESHSVRHRMRNLKKRIIDLCLPVRFFRNLHELGMMIRKDWEGVINQVYEDPKYPIYAESQDFFDLHYHKSHVGALCNWFVPSTQATEILNELNTFVHSITRGTKSKSDLGSIESKKSVLLICGERGCGKSTLAAWWLQTFCRLNPDVPVISHFCGTSMSSTDVRSILRQWTAELRRVHYVNILDWDGILEKGTELGPLYLMVQAFSAAANLGPCVLLIDGVDLLTETFGLSVQEVKELSWLPDALPPHCKLIITTTYTDLTYKSLTARTDVHTLTCPHLSDPSVHHSILLKHLSLPCKKLPTNVLQRMGCKKLCHSPAFLALCGTELRSCGVQREKELLEKYIDIDSIPELWVKVILRWVKDYSRSATTEAISPCKAPASIPKIASFREDLSGWVWDTLCLLQFSHAGLTEVEVLALLKDLGYCGNLKVQVLEWARLHSAFWPWVQEKANGHLTIMHQSFSQAINMLLGSRCQIKSQNDYHRILADFFQKSSLQLCSWVRKMEEIPWHLMQIGSFSELHSFLSNLVTTEALSSSLKQHPQLITDVVHYWALLREKGFEPASSFHNLMVLCCRMESLDGSFANHISTWKLSLFCSNVLLCFGEIHRAEELLLQADQIFQKGRWKAEELDKDVLSLPLKVQHMLANLYVQMHLLKDAKMYCYRGLETAQYLAAHHNSAEVKLIVGQLLCHLCLILRQDGWLYAVPELLKEIRSDRYTSAHPYSESTVLLLKAIHKLSLNETQTAEKCLQSALAIRRRWYGSDHPLVGEVEEILVDLWVDTQSDTDWVQRRIIEMYQHVLSIKETEAQTFKTMNLQHNLAVILVKFGKVLLRSSSKAERREGLDLLGRASDIKIRFLGPEHPHNRELEQ
nr:tetratricopeptide repeat protein 41 isoform X2 [Misgurnus anguillicaudatus]